MTSAVYPKFREARWTGGYDVTDGTLTAMPLDGYTYNTAHDFLNDVNSNAVGSGVALSGVTVTSGLLDADAVSFSDVALGDTISSVVLYLDTGVAGTSPLVCYIDTTQAGSAVSFTSVGAAITCDWPDGIVQG